MTMRAAACIALCLALTALASTDELPQLRRSHRAFATEKALTAHYWNGDAHRRFARINATPAALRKRADDHERVLRTADPAIARFYKDWKPDGEPIYVPVFADHAKLRGEDVVVIVFNWEFPQAATRNGRMNATHVRIVAVRASTGKVVIDERCG